MSLRYAVLPLLVVAIPMLLAPQARGQAYELRLGADGRPTDESTLSEPIVVQRESTSITVVCDEGVVCGSVKLLLFRGGQPPENLRRTNLQPKTAFFSLQRSSITPGTKLGYSIDDERADVEYSLSIEDAPPQDSAAPGDDQLLSRLCEGTFDATPYDQRGDRAEVIVTPTGLVLAQDIALFDEDDVLVVTVVADPLLMPRLLVRRSSAFGRRGVIRIAGEDETGVVGSIRQAIVEDRPCTARSFEIRNFEPGKGEVEIFIAGSPERITGTFDLNVNPLYTGLLSLGAVRTEAINPSYKLVRRSDTPEGEPDQLLIRGHEGDYDFLYGLFYTPYVWGRRDLEKTYPFYTYLNPTIGLSVDQPLDNLFVGVSAALPNGIVATAGGHLRRIDTIAESVEVEEGDPYDGGEGDNPELPIADEVTFQFFVGVSIDLRAAVKVFGAVFGATAEGN